MPDAVVGPPVLSSQRPDDWALCLPSGDQRSLPYSTGNSACPSQACVLLRSSL